MLKLLDKILQDAFIARYEAFLLIPVSFVNNHYYFNFTNLVRNIPQLLAVI
jgi:hypothetical protein